MALTCAPSVARETPPCSRDEGLGWGAKCPTNGFHIVAKCFSNRAQKDRDTHQKEPLGRKCARVCAEGGGMVVQFWNKIALPEKEKKSMKRLRSGWSVIIVCVCPPPPLLNVNDMARIYY